MTIFPSNTGWITPRTDDALLTDQNCKIILPQKIDKIDKVVLYLPYADIQFHIAIPDASLSQLYLDEQHTKSLVELDVTHYVVEKAEYDTLVRQNANGGISIGPKRLENTWYYEHGSNEILLPNSIMKGNLPMSGKPITDYVVTSAIYNVVYNGGKNDGKLYVYYGPHNSNNRVLTAEDECRVFPKYISSIMEMQFRIYYTPLGESVKLQVPKTNPQPNQFCIPYSQQQPIVDNTTLGREMLSVANRAGCEKKELVRTLHSIKEYRSPHGNYYYRERDAQGNFNGNVWKLTSANLQIYSESLMRVTETWSKNWSYRSENVPINREFRSWNIPANVVQRNLLWQDYCLVTRNAGAQLDDNCLLSANAKKELMRGLDGTSSGKMTECNNMWYYQTEKVIDDNGGTKTRKYGAVLSCSAFGFGNSLVFSGKTKDNLSAGAQRVKSDNNDNEYQYCRDVYYCYDDGKLDSMYIQLGSALQSDNDEAIYLYPECYSNDKGTVNMYNKSAGICLFKEKVYDTDKDWNLFKVDKDPCEQLNFTYQLHLLTDDGFLVIGSTWASNNPLVKQRNEAQKIKVWKLTQHLPQGAEVMTTTYGEEYGSDGTANSKDLFFVSSTADGTNAIAFNAEPNDGVGVCVTDENNNVLIAFNDNKSAIFVVKFTHDYKTIYAALKN